MALACLLACASCAAPAVKSARGNAPALPTAGIFKAESVQSIKVDEWPVIPVISENSKAIYRESLTHGRNAQVFSKLGDCMTENPYFLLPFTAQQFDLGAYAALRPALAHYQPASFARKSLAAAGGFNVAGPFDPTWSDPAICPNGESPLLCEYRLQNPSVALIMFGTNDVGYTDAATYDYYLRSIVSTTLDSHILPVLSTFPNRPENAEKSRLLNQIAVRVAQDYDVPIINLNRALAALPNQGVDPADPIHLSVPTDKRVDIFDPLHLRAGFTMRNLVTLQALTALLDATR